MPAVVGVPVIAPAALRLKPGGGMPVAIAHVYGAVPPAACSVWLYGVPITPLGRLVVVTVSAEPTTMLSPPVAVSALASLTLTVKLEVPAVVGVPVIAPAALRLKPAGKLPVAIDQV